MSTLSTKSKFMFLLEYRINNGTKGFIELISWDQSIVNKALASLQDPRFPDREITHQILVFKRNK